MIPEILHAPLGLSILYLLRQAESQTPLTARELVARTKSEIADEVLPSDLIQLNQTVIIYKLVHLGREEIQAILHVDDIRKTCVYREAKEEGQQEERERQIQRDRHALPKLTSMKITPEAIADILNVEVDFVRQELANRSILN